MRFTNWIIQNERNDHVEESNWNREIIPSNNKFVTLFQQLVTFSVPLNGKIFQKNVNHMSYNSIPTVLCYI